MRCKICGCVRRAPCHHRECSGAARTTRRSPSPGASGGSEGQDSSNLSNGETGQTKEMGPIGFHVTTPNKEVKEHVSAASCADEVSCTTKDWLQRSHRAVKRRQERGSNGRPQSPRASSLEQDDDSCIATPRIKKNERCRTHRMRKPQKRTPRHARRRRSGQARERPSHLRPVGLRENQQNTRNRQIKCNKCKRLSATKWSKFENWFFQCLFCDL